MAATAHDLRRMQNGHAVNGSLAYDLDWAVRERELRHAGEAPKVREREIVREEPKAVPVCRCGSVSRSLWWRLPVLRQ